MCASYICQDTDCRFDNILQGTHFSRFRDTGLQYGKLRLFTHLPHGQRYAYLGIVAAGRACYHPFGTQQLMQPLFHNGFSVAACNADNRNLKPVPMLLCQFLQGFQRVGNDQ